MAILFPKIEIIKNFKVPPTEGELKLLTFLNENLDNSHEIFFQPFINGDNPDIVVMKKDAGVIIFEVKDWNLDCYDIDLSNKKKQKWTLKKNDYIIKSPLDQVKEYKNNLFNLHIEDLAEKGIMQKELFGRIIYTVVYFHNEPKEKIKEKILGEKPKASKLRNLLVPKNILETNWVVLLGNDSLNKDDLKSVLDYTIQTAPNIAFTRKEFFTENIYNAFMRYLLPPLHKIEDGVEIKYTKEQAPLIVSKEKARQKIKGVAGSGKTLVLGKRAVNAHKRTGKRILILTYNLTLKNYIHDRISDVREEFSWDNFYIINYHEFFKQRANEYNLVIPYHEFSEEELNGYNPWEDTNFFEEVKDQIIPFEAIFIDEVQDYKQEWLDIITKYFLTTDGEFVVFGDEKQNIYDRELDEKKEIKIRTVTGDWNRSLNRCQRSTTNIVSLAKQFQQEFFTNKYTTDPFQEGESIEINFETKAIEYFHFAENWNQEHVWKYMLDAIKKYNIHPSNICILNSRIDYIRELDFIIRTQTNEKTKTTFEQEKIYQILKKQAEQRSNKIDSLEWQIESTRKNKKNNFWMGGGTMKLSTIHSFKGWEIHSLFLIIDSQDFYQEQIDELIYTGITRARANLFIFNFGNFKYDKFFRHNIQNCYDY